MSRIHVLLYAALLTLAAGMSVIAVEIKKTGQPASAPVVTAGVSAERVRFTAPSNVVRMQMQVISETGQILFDVNSKGNVLDWSLQDSSGQRLQGSYVTVVTVKSLSGKVSRKLGTLLVQEKQLAVQPISSAQLTPEQSQALSQTLAAGEQAQFAGALEDATALTVVSEGEPDAITTVAHDGNHGEITRSRGALSFRLGDFFSGKDEEQMRLTEEGNLGIGTAKPKVKLDVAGTIRAREGYAFSDGSKLDVNDKGALTLKSSNGTIAPNVSGTGTQNRLTKWTDNGGTLGDSFVAEAGGTGLQLTAPPSTLADTNLLFLNSTNGTTGMLAGSTPSYDANNGPFFAMRGNTFTTFPNQRGMFTISAGNISSPVGDDASVKFNTGSNLLRMVIRPSGNVGIGTPNPTSLLDVAGDINTSTQFNIGSQRVLSVSEMGNTFAGVSAGAANAGSFNSFFGENAGFHNHWCTTNAFFGTNAGFTNGDGSFNTMIGAVADVGSPSLTNATAVGSRAYVTQSDSLVLGSINGQNGTTHDTNVGIGTTAPQARLEIQAGADSDGTFDPKAIDLGYRSGGFRHWIRTRHNSILGSGNAIDFYVNNSTSASGSAGPGTGSLHVMTLDSGNVGIGTAAPSAKLSVVASGATEIMGTAQSTTFRTSAGRLGTDIPDELPLASIGFLTVDSRGVPVNNVSLGIRARRTVSDFTGSWTRTAIGLGMDVDNTVRAAGGGSALWLHANGNIGIGTDTPSAKLDVNGNLRVATLGAAGSTQLCRNASNEISTCSSSLRYKTDLHPFSGGLNVVNRLHPITFRWKADQMLDIGLGAEDVAAVEPLLVSR